MEKTAPALAKNAKERGIHRGVVLVKGSRPYPYVVAVALSPASSRSMVSFTLPSANSAATRTAFFMAFVFDDPWVMMHTPLMPSSGAPPYSV